MSETLPERYADFCRRLRCAEIRHRRDLLAYYRRQISAAVSAAPDEPVRMMFSFDLTDGHWRPSPIAWRPA